MQEIRDCTYVCICCACAVQVCVAGDAWGVPSACLGGAWHGTKQAQCVEYTTFDQNMLNMFNQK